MSYEVRRNTGNFICMGCGKRGTPGVFVTFVNCPECGSSEIMDADIWDRFGPAHPKEAQESRREVPVKSQDDGPVAPDREYQ